MVEPPPLKNMSKNGNLPQVGVKKKHIWNYHLGIQIITCHTFPCLRWDVLHSTSASRNATTEDSRRSTWVWHVSKVFCGTVKTLPPVSPIIVVQWKMTLCKEVLIFPLHNESYERRTSTLNKRKPATNSTCCSGLVVWAQVVWNSFGLPKNSFDGLI